MADLSQCSTPTSQPPHGAGSSCSAAHGQARLYRAASGRGRWSRGTHSSTSPRAGLIKSIGRHEGLDRIYRQTWPSSPTQSSGPRPACDQECTATAADERPSQRMISSIRHETLDHVLIFEDAHARPVCTTYQVPHNTSRPHQARVRYHPRFRRSPPRCMASMHRCCSPGSSADSSTRTGIPGDMQR